MDASRDCVVVGVDGSQDSDRAIAYAVARAALEGLPLRLVHVNEVYVVGSPMIPTLPQETVRRIGEGILRHSMEVATGAGMPEAMVELVQTSGPRTASLTDHLDGARCAVLGTRRPSLSHLVTGPTSVAVAAHSHVPVHCVPSAWAPGREDSRRVVVGVDGSEVTEELLGLAVDEADLRGAELEVVHAWIPDSPYDAAVTGHGLRSEWERLARSALEQQVAAVADPRGISWTLSVCYDRVAKALHEHAAHADALVVGRRAHHTAYSLLLGTTTRALLHASPCPLVVVPVGRHT